MKLRQLQRMRMYIIGVWFVIAMIIGLFNFFELRMNLTPSYPIGLYQLQSQKSHKKGELVLICPPNTKKFHHNNHGFLRIDDECDAGTIPLIKKIVAKEGDQVTVVQYVKINGQVQPMSKVYQQDHRGASMNPCYGEHTIKKDQVWVMSDYYEKSFDSRYFCEVSKKNIIGVIKPILVFGYNDK